jgi:hypothetical protein
MITDKLLKKYVLIVVELFNLWGYNLPTEHCRSKEGA